MTDKELQTLDRIANAMERIASALEKNSTYSTSFIGLDDTNVNPSLEQEFFELITNIYAEEEKVKVERNLMRKGSRRVSVELVNQISSFLNSKLNNVYASPTDGGYIVLEKEKTPVALLRFQTDLGFTRGEKWQDAIDHGIEIAYDLGVPENHIYFVIGAIKNSLDNSHVKKLLGMNNVPDNSILLSNSYHHLLEQYCQCFAFQLNYLLV